jgi:hypothetical protein
MRIFGQNRLANVGFTFSAGQTQQQITIPIVSDRIREANQDFFVNLSVPRGAILSDPQGKGTILNDD